MADPVPSGSDVSSGTYRCTNRGYELEVGSTKHLPPLPVVRERAVQHGHGRRQRERPISEGVGPLSQGVVAVDELERLDVTTCSQSGSSTSTRRRASSASSRVGYVSIGVPSTCVNTHSVSPIVSNAPPRGAGGLHTLEVRVLEYWARTSRRFPSETIFRRVERFVDHVGGWVVILRLYRDLRTQHYVSASA